MRRELSGRGAEAIQRASVHARRALGLGLDLVFPPNCLACQVAIDSPAPLPLCTGCTELLVDRRSYCPRCGAAGPTGDCPRCARTRFRFDGVIRLGPYQGPLRDAVLRGKRPQDRGLMAVLGHLLADIAGPRLDAWAVDVVVPVPMHWLRRAWRGASSPESIGQPLARRSCAPLRPELLARRRRTRPQASLSPNQRRRNVRGAFRVRPHRDLPGACVLLVDDILTTGATMNEAARTLLAAGAARVYAAVLARADEAL